MTTRLKKKYSINLFSYDVVNRWKCEKCPQLFSSYEDLRIHKQDLHAY